MLMRLVFIALTALFATVYSYDLLVEITAHEDPVGVFFYGESLPDHEILNGTQPEQFLTVVKPTELAYERVLYETSLLFRSQDFHTRVLVKFHAAPEEPDNPYRMSFFNLAFGDRGGDKSVELKHSTSGFIWIEGGHVVSHYTGENHIFTIRNGALKDVFSVKLLPPRHDEL